MLKLKYLLMLLLISVRGISNEGMWLPQLLGQLNEAEMKSLGLKLTVKDIYDINKGSLKDAIVIFGNGCTGEIISDQGLLLTNHHCGYSAIQNHSTLTNNYLETGFWAKDKQQELSNEGLTATFIVRIDDVTATVTKGITKSMSEANRQELIKKNIKQATENVKKEEWQTTLVRSFFEGNKYYLFVTEVHKDVRLVGAPPSSIGKFGSDTDNWMWPRHTGDFAIFRIYADKNNRPADYSPDNVPFKPRRSLKISLDGVAPNDFTMVFGFPGRTQEYLHSAAVQQTLNVLNPVKIEIRDRTLKVWDSYMRKDEQIKMQYAAKYASISNFWKKWIGENLGLKQSKGVEKKIKYEQMFAQKVNASKIFRPLYGNLLSNLAPAYKNIEPYTLTSDLYTETVRAIEILNFINKNVFRFVDSSDKAGDDMVRYEKAKKDLQNAAGAFHKDYNATIDKEVFNTVFPYFLEKMPPQSLSQNIKQIATTKELINAYYEKTNFASPDKFRAILNKPKQEALQALKADTMYLFAVSLQQMYVQNNAPKQTELQNTINLLQRTYMQAQIDVLKDKRFYPDANSTLRLSYGKVEGCRPRNGIVYDYYTDLDGVMEKYLPGDYEFDVPAKLIDLYDKKDYGVYGIGGKMPVCFIASNHTTGGNSGSPALDAYGNLIGLNFDRAWEGTMSDINYDPSICRNIMVDARYILFIVDKFAGAKHLIDEMVIVHPKKKKGNMVKKS